MFMHTNVGIQNQTQFSLNWQFTDEVLGHNKRTFSAHFK